MNIKTKQSNCYLHILTCVTSVIFLELIAYAPFRGQNINVATYFKFSTHNSMKTLVDDRPRNRNIFNVRCISIYNLTYLQSMSKFPTNRWHTTLICLKNEGMMH